MPFDVKQKRVYELALAGNNQFVSGGGGVGKTYVVQEVIDELRKQGRNVLVCAFTKLAALNLDPQNGLTIFKAFNTLLYASFGISIKVPIPTLGIMIPLFNSKFITHSLNIII